MMGTGVCVCCRGIWAQAYVYAVEVWAQAYVYAVEVGSELRVMVRVRTVLLGVCHGWVWTVRVRTVLLGVMRCSWAMDRGVGV